MMDWNTFINIAYGFGKKKPTKTKKARERNQFNGFTSAGALAACGKHDFGGENHASERGNFKRYAWISH
jgi:hypothetical protein